MAMTKHMTGTRKEWLEARLELLEAEKELTRRSDELARRRQELPWVRVDKGPRVPREREAFPCEAFEPRDEELAVSAAPDHIRVRVPFELIDQVFEVMARAARHIFQVLAKRADRMLQWFRERGGAAIAAHVWVGVSVESSSYWGASTGSAR
jgi:protein gp37